MTSAGPRLTIFGVLTLAACSGGDTVIPFTSSGPSGSTDDEPTTDDATPPGSTGGVGDGSGGATGSTASTGPGAVDDSTDGADTSASTGPSCPPGEAGCPCAMEAMEACGDSLWCNEGVCEAFACDEDLFEANDDEESATFLGEINDNDGNGSIVSASLRYPGDVDWFRYDGDDDITGDVDPARDVVASAGLRICKFLECENGLDETEFECPAGTEYALSPMARPGCCAADLIELPDLNCTGVTEDNASVYIRVDRGSESCVTYSVSFHY